MLNAGPALARAADRHGVVTRTTLLAAGLNDRELGRAVAAGWLRRLAEGVFVVGGVLTTPLVLAAAATAAGGEGAAICRVSALALHGLGRFHLRPPIDVVVPYVRRTRPRADWMRGHRSRTLTPDQVVTVQGLLVTDPVRSAHESAASLTDGALRDVLVEVMRRTDLSPYDLWVRAVDLGNIPGIGRAKRVLRGLDPGLARTVSPAEADAVTVLARADVPPPLVNHDLTDADGRHIARVDLWWPCCRLAVEIDGLTFHSLPSAVRYDGARQNRLVARGITVLRFSADDVRQHPVRFAREVGAMLERLGHARHRTEL